MSTPRKRTAPAVIEMLKAADNALATAAVLHQQARAKRREITQILDRIADVDWVKRYPETVVKATQKIHMLDAQAGRTEAEAETHTAHAHRYLMAAQLFDRE